MRLGSTFGVNKSRVSASLLNSVQIKEKRRQRCKLFVTIGLLIFIITGITLAIVFSGKNPEPPTPEPVFPDGMNPYRVEYIGSNLSFTSGVLGLRPSMPENGFKEFDRLQAQNLENVETRKIPTGVNNKVISLVRFEFGQVD